MEPHLSLDLILTLDELDLELLEAQVDDRGLRTASFYEAEFELEPESWN